MKNERLAQQMAFLAEADRLKRVLRRTELIGGGRRENSAEHSWHFALVALTLAEHAATAVDMLRVLRMALLHDLVEIDAGDSWVYDPVAMADKAAREQRAAERIFGLLPVDQAREFRELWEEFEAQATGEARFAASVDRLCGMLPNYHNEGGVWREGGVSAARVTARNIHMAAGAPAVWEMAQGWIDEAVENGWIAPE